MAAERDGGRTEWQNAVEVNSSHDGFEKGSEDGWEASEVDPRRRADGVCHSNRVRQEASLILGPACHAKKGCRPLVDRDDADSKAANRGYNTPCLRLRCCALQGL